MNALTRLGLYAAGLAVVFGGAYVTAGAVVPESVVDRWSQTDQPTHGEETSDESGDPGAH